MRKILVLRGGALGDFIVTLPALDLLRRRWPESRIELVGNAVAAEIGRLEGLLDAVHSQHEARWSGLYGAASLTTEAVGWLKTFDLIVSYWPDPQGEIAALFPLRPGQTFVAGAALPTRSPASAHYAQALEPLGLELARAESFYRLRQFAGCGEDKFARRIGIHPGSGSPRKNWPMARWLALGSWLQDEFGMELFIVGGEAELETAAFHEIAQLGELAQGWPLPQLGSALAGCRLFLGHDSGVSHFAAACGVPSILLFGPTDPAVWAPPAPHVRALRSGPEMSSLGLEDVQAAVTAALGGRT